MKRRLALLESSKLGSEGDLVLLINTFLPFTGRIIHDLDMANDFEEIIGQITIFLFRLFKKLDPGMFPPYEDKYLVGYVQRSIRRELVRISQKRDEDPIPISQLEYEIDQSKYPVFEDSYNIGQSDILKQLLTNQQFQVIFQYFYLQVGVNEIAASLHISKTMVRKHLHNTLEKLKSHPELKDIL